MALLDMFRLRSTASIFQLVLAISVLVIVFVIIQISYLPSTDSRRPSSQVLEEQLIHLESDLSKSRQVASELQQAVRRLITAPPLDAAAEQRHPKNLKKPVLPPGGTAEAKSSVGARPDAGGSCDFGQTPPKRTDVQMLEAYREDPFENPDGGVWKQGWQISYDPQQWSTERKLRVFVVPHSHNDPGWIKTFEHYYSAQTRHIFNSMVDALQKYPRMRFIWAEISYLSLWWTEATAQQRRMVADQVARGQLELVTAGWVMPDEANAHYWAMLDQLVTGHEWLRLHLNATVSNGWSIDPFGLSPTQTYLLRRSGFDHMVIQRVHYAMKRKLARQKQLEFWWRQTWDSGGSTDMFCHTMPFYSYDLPHSCGPDPKVCCQFDFARLPGGKYSCPWRVPPRPITPANVNERAALLLDQYRKKAQLYRGCVVMVPLGDDFRYDSAAEWDAQYHNYQALFDHMNAQTDWHVEAQFGTLADYFRALEQTTQSDGGGLAAFPRLSGDFFTYADKNDEYWSGYYTSRPFHKRMDRELVAALRAAEVLYSLTRASAGGDGSAIYTALMADLVTARRHLALFQHHDGITGTAKDHVVTDYGAKMLAALRLCERVIQHCTNLLLTPPTAAAGQPDLSQRFYRLAAARRRAEAPATPTVLQLPDAASAASGLRLVVYNSLARRRAELVTVHVNTAHVKVVDEEGRPVASQCSPVWDGGAALVGGQHKLQFVALLAPLSLSTFTLAALSEPERDGWRHHSLASVTLVDDGGGGGGAAVSDLSPYQLRRLPALPADLALSSGMYRLTFSQQGLLQSVKHAQEDEPLPVSLEFVTYGAAQKKGDRSGAYLFLPDGPARPLAARPAAVRVLSGALCSSVTVHLPEVVHQVTLVSAAEADAAGYVDITNTANIAAHRNLELAMRLSTGVRSGHRFVTDLNGFQTIERRRFDKLPLQGNYYPVPGLIYIEDGRRRLTLTLAQPLGGSSLADGQLEVMLDRRLMQDDNRGLGQGVTDTRPAASSFRLLLEPLQQQQPQPQRKPLPSLLAAAAQRAQLHPPVVLEQLTDEQSETTPPAAARAGGWRAAAGDAGAACDLELVALRTEVASTDGGDVFVPSDTALLTVRRRAVDCRFPEQRAARRCGGPRGKLRISELLGAGSFAAETRQVSLTGTHQGRAVALSSSLALEPMEMYSFRVTRRR